MHTAGQVRMCPVSGLALREGTEPTVIKIEADYAPEGVEPGKYPVCSDILNDLVAKRLEWLIKQGVLAADTKSLPRNFYL